jgi:streptogramin lyase
MTTGSCVRHGFLLVALGSSAFAQHRIAGRVVGEDAAAPGAPSNLAGTPCGVLGACPSPNPSPGGLAWDGTHVWQANYFGQPLIQRIDPATCAVAHTIPAPGPYIGGLTWDGTALWACDEEAGEIYRLDPSTGAVLATIPAPAFGSPDPNSSDLAWDGQALWHVDYSPAAIYRLDPANGNVLATLPPPGTGPSGISYHSGMLIVSDYQVDEIFVVDAATGAVLSSCLSPDGHTWGVEVSTAGSTWISGMTTSQLFEIDTALVSTPAVYCTAGTSTNGCVPSIAASGTPSASASSGFTISVGQLEGQKSALVFYSISGRQASPWGLNSTSLLCVKAPVQRMAAQNSGGLGGSCNGAIGQDWLAFLAANPGALGAPFASGDVVQARGWYRDPPAAKTTNLSDGLEFTLEP